jgi:cytochrome c
MAIADKYRGQPAAMDTAIKRVSQGSTGVWGQVAMLPHPQHTTDEIAIMCNWIFSLDSKKGAPELMRGLAGTVLAPQADTFGTGILEATYTDAGRSSALALSSKATVTLRSRKVEADRNDGLSGPTRLSEGGCTNKYCLGSINDGHSVRFSKINLADVHRIKARVSSGGAGGKIEFRANSKTGPVLGTLEVANTGGWGTWVEKEVTLLDGTPRERSDVHVVFVNPGQSALMNLDWLEFLP